MPRCVAYSHARHRVYQGVAGMESFEPWLDRLDRHMTEAALGEEAGHIPPEWYGDDWQALERLGSSVYTPAEGGCAN